MTLLSLARRLERVADAVPVGCPVCRDWWGVALCNDAARHDCMRPEVCPACGRSVPITSRVVIEGVDWRVV